MEHWVGFGSTAAVIVRWMDLRQGEVPLGVREGTAPMDGSEAAWSAWEWFGEREALKARSLYLELEHTLDYVDHHAVVGRLERALRSGELIAYRVRPWAGGRVESGHPTYKPAQPKPPIPKPGAPGSTKTEAPTTFSVRWVDELGEAIADLEVIFSISGTRHKATTDRAGVAHYTDPGGSGFAWVEPVDLDALREAVRPRWDTIREGEVLIDAEAHVVTLREPVEGVSLVAEELETLSVQPYAERVRLLGEHFDLNKSFLVPEGLAGARAIAKDRARLRASALLIVGHTDTSGTEAYNDALSLERAQSLADYLTQNVDGWLVCYEASIAHQKRWGAKEDLLMIEAMHDSASRPVSDAPVRWYQRTRGLTVDGIAGPITRRQLIGEYMALIGAAVPSDVTMTVHGCGEAFPLEATGDDVTSAQNRRVEVYFFDKALGVQPPAPGATSKPGSPEYPEWVKRARRTEDYYINVVRQCLSVRLHNPERIIMPYARAVIVLSSGQFELQADEHGFIYIFLDACPERVRIQWGAIDSPISLPYTYDIIYDCDLGDAAHRDRRRLHNLGYNDSLSLDIAAKLFQLDYSVDLDEEGAPIGLYNGALPLATHRRVEQIYNLLECDASTS